ncbi:MAG TPA: hypothetical protein DDW19_08880 [Anaerolineaceae bacterium]|jgi:hypothetical protein|nr:hypothetical protein [Anaerolineaceae bacterium]
MSTTLGSRQLNRAITLARWLIRCHPREFRQQYESELDQVLRTLMRFGMDSGKAGVANYLWRICIPDLCLSMIRERFNEWEENMKRNYGSWIGAGLIVLWILYVGLSLARIFLHLPIKDPGNWLIGDTPANWAYNSLNWFTIFGPIIALILLAAPYIKFSKGSENGEMAVIRLRNVAGASRVLIIVTGLISLMILFIVLIGRML